MAKSKYVEMLHFLFKINISRRYAFVRCEDEREQSLFHLQTLNTVDFSCFTNAYPKSSILYQVIIRHSTEMEIGSPQEKYRNCKKYSLVIC